MDSLKEPDWFTADYSEEISIIKDVVGSISRHPKFKQQQLEELQYLLSDQPRVHSRARLTDTKDMIRQWGLWNWQNNPLLKLGYQSVSSFYKPVNKSGKREPVIITDTQAMTIDGKIASVIYREESTGVAIALYGLFKMSYENIGKRLNVNRNHAKTILDSGIYSVDEHLDRVNFWNA